MRSRLQAWFEDLGDQFWLRPALVVLACTGLAFLATYVDRTQPAGNDFASITWIYSGGADGARSLLSSVASSAIGVASTIFSITIAALSLASGQMGPRLLRNFVRDGRNQLALGIFLGTFAYALVVLRTVRTANEHAFVPSLAITGSMLLAFICLGTLVWFVHHIATSINIERVIDTVHGDLCDAILVHTRETADLVAPDDAPKGQSIIVSGSDFLQALDADTLADWAAAHDVTVRLRIRPGDYLPFGAPVGLVTAVVDDASAAFDRALTFGRKQAALQDLEFSVRQLNEIAVRALSPGINNPFSAGSVLDRFGDALCRIVPRHMPSGAFARDGRIVLTHPVTDYDGLCDAMFHTIRQNAGGSAYVLIRLVDILSRVAEVERSTTRCATLRRHGDLAMANGADTIGDQSGLADLRACYQRLKTALDIGASSGGFLAERSARRQRGRPATIEGLVAGRLGPICDVWRIDMDLGIAGRVAVVTGADSGMGFEVARFLLEAGVKVMMTDREKETLEAEADKLKPLGAVATHPADLTGAGAVDRLRDATAKAFGPADILVHAAGITGPVGDFLGMSDEDWTKTIDIDFMAAVRLCRAFIPAMRAKKWGRIVLFSSEDGLQPYIEDLPYCACKAAILNLSKGLSKAYGPDGLTVNSVLPAFIASPMTDKMMEKRAKEKGVSLDEAVSSFLDEERPGIAVRRRGEAKEVASAVAYLCSAHASYVNGTAMRVDGGSVQTI